MNAVHAERLFDGQTIAPDRTVLIADGLVAGVSPGRQPGAVTVPLLAPGFIDIQVNGGGGVLLNDDPSPAAIARIAAAHRRFGTTGFLATLISDSRARIAAAIGGVAAALAAGQPGLLGLHLEGPFLNPARRGVHPAANIATAGPQDVALLAGLGRRGRTLVTLAPERVPAGFIAQLVQHGVRVAAGHSLAGPAELARAVAEGLTGATHLYNAMSQMTARDPGLVGAVLADDRVFAGIIADGLHVAPEPLRVALKAKGAARLMLVSDAMPPVGAAAAGGFDLMGTAVRVEGRRLLTGEGTLAGALLDMGAAVRHMVAAGGASLEQALAMASTTPASFLGLADRLGAIRPGMRADLVALDERLGILATWIGGVMEGGQP
ncbi:MAG: N-acetylglucosamine-6-phosphate deacetylase [Thalassobaculales bacterium]